jgi:hypothetical protein
MRLPAILAAVVVLGACSTAADETAGDTIAETTVETSAPVAVTTTEAVLPTPATTVPTTLINRETDLAINDCISAAGAPDMGAYSVDFQDTETLLDPAVELCDEAKDQMEADGLDGSHPLFRMIADRSLELSFLSYDIAMVDTAAFDRAVEIDDSAIAFFMEANKLLDELRG